MKNNQKLKNEIEKRGMPGVTLGRAYWGRVLSMVLILTMLFNSLAIDGEAVTRLRSVRAEGYLEPHVGEQELSLGDDAEEPEYSYTYPWDGNETRLSDILYALQLPIYVQNITPDMIGVGGAGEDAFVDPANPVDPVAVAATDDGDYAVIPQRDFEAASIIIDTYDGLYNIRLETLPEILAAGGSYTPAYTTIDDPAQYEQEAPVEEQNYDLSDEPQTTTHTDLQAPVEEQEITLSDAPLTLKSAPVTRLMGAADDNDDGTNDSPNDDTDNDNTQNDNTDNDNTQNYNAKNDNTQNDGSTTDGETDDSPVRANVLTYNGTDQALITKNDAYNGDLEYSINDQDYAAEIPQGRLVGNYMVYYRPVGVADAVSQYVDVTIAPKAVTVTAKDQTKTYGEADPELTATVEGLIGEDTITYSVSRAEGSNAGEYAITPSGDAAQGNYAVSFVPGKLTITRAAVTVTADDKTKVYGEHHPDGRCGAGQLHRDL